MHTYRWFGHFWLEISYFSRFWRKHTSKWVTLKFLSYSCEKNCCFLGKSTPRVKIVHCRRQWRQGQISPLNTTFLELWLKRKVFVSRDDFPMKRTMKTMDHETMVTNSDYRQWQRYSLRFSTASVLASIMGWCWNIILNTYHDRLIIMVADLILSKIMRVADLILSKRSTSLARTPSSTPPDPVLHWYL